MTARAAGGILAISFILSVAGPATPARASHVWVGAEDLARIAGDIVVGTLASRVPAWNASGDLILTEHTVAVEQVLKGDAPAAMRFDLPGGEIGGVGMEFGDAPALAVGTRYVLFLDDWDGNSLVPLVGGDQGAFRQDVDAAGNAVAVAEGPGGLAEEIGARPEGMLWADFVERVTELVDATAGLGPPDWLPTEPDPTLPAKTYGLVSGRTDFTAGPPEGGDGAGGAGAKGAWNHVIDGPPLVWDPLPHSWSWSPTDQNMMAYWNDQTSPDLHWVYTVPDGQWGVGNGESEMAGFPTSAQLEDQWGKKWGPTTSATAIRQWGINGKTDECDIALNPAYTWTLDVEYATRGFGDVQGFQATVLHELGHAGSLLHPWKYQNVWWPSIMNYAPGEFRDPVLHADDTASIRLAYQSLKGVYDGGVVAHFTFDNPGSWSASYGIFGPQVAAVEVGESFDIGGNFMLENTGTIYVDDPLVDVYLCPDRWSKTGCRKTQTAGVGFPLAPASVYVLGGGILGPVVVPEDLEPGDYWVALRLVTNPADQDTRNDWSWSPVLNEIFVSGPLSCAAQPAAGRANPSGAFLVLAALALVAAAGRRRRGA